VTIRESARRRVRVDQCDSAVSAVGVSVLVCLRSSCSHVTGRRAVRFVRLALKVVAQNDGDFVDVIQLNVQYTFRRRAVYTDGITSYLLLLFVWWGVGK
jgi:predicted small secreted protein